MAILRLRHGDDEDRQARGIRTATADHEWRHAHMKNIWLYHINPKSPENWTYGWTVDEPKTLLTSSDRQWPAGNMFKQVSVGDEICVNVKNVRPRPDGVYVVGVITKVLLRDRRFVWRPDKARSARTLVAPIQAIVVRRFFGRGYGAAMQRLPPKRQEAWLRLLGKGEVVDGVPLLKVRRRPASAIAPTSDPEISREHGLFGELHALKVLRRRYPARNGYRVVHVARGTPNADHDLVVRRGRSVVLFVEVKTRVGYPGDPVIISERELNLRRLYPLKHAVFIVYLVAHRAIRCVLEIDRDDNFALAPRQSWMTPGVDPADRSRRRMS